MLTKEERLLRQKGLGGSDIGAILGMSTFKTPLDIYRSKVEPLVDEEPTEAQHRGNMAEERILSWYASHYGVSVDTPPMLFHPELPLFANIDGYDALANRIIEAKSVMWSNRKQWGKPGTSEMPQAYLLQVAHYCALYGAPEAHVAVEWSYSNEDNPEAMRWTSYAYDTFVYVRDLALEEIMTRAATKFWTKHVLPRVQPKPKTKTDALYLWPHHKDDAYKEAPPVLAQAVAKLKELKDQKKELDNSIDNLEIKIKEGIGESEGLLYNNKVIATWKNGKSRSTQYDLLMEDFPDIYNKYVKESKTRIFRIKP